MDEIELPQQLQQQATKVDQALTTYLLKKASQGVPNVPLIQNTLQKIAHQTWGDGFRVSDAIELLRIGEWVHQFEIIDAMVEADRPSHLAVSRTAIEIDRRTPLRFHQATHDCLLVDSRPEHRVWYTMVFSPGHLFSLWLDFDKSTAFYYDSLDNRDHHTTVRRILNIYADSFRQAYNVDLLKYAIQRVRGGRQLATECGIVCLNTFFCLARGESIPKSYTPGWDLDCRLQAFVLNLRQRLGR